jgi:hypothetical protein
VSQYVTHLDVNRNRLRWMHTYQVLSRQPVLKGSFQGMSSLTESSSLAWSPLLADEGAFQSFDCDPSEGVAVKSSREASYVAGCP